MARAAKTSTSSTVGHRPVKSLDTSSCKRQGVVVLRLRHHTTPSSPRGAYLAVERNLQGTLPRKLQLFIHTI